MTLPLNLDFFLPGPTITHVSRSQAKCQSKKGRYPWDGYLILNLRVRRQLVVTLNLWEKLSFRT